MTTSKLHKLYCHNCLNLMAELTEDEYKDIMALEGHYGLCFDCDPDSASTVPNLFWQWQPGEAFVIDSGIFVVHASGNYLLYVFDVPHTREHARARSCLSSSTYLHKPAEKSGGEDEYLIDEIICSECGSAEIGNGKLGLVCLSCGRLLQGGREIVIPSWILESKGDNPSKMDSMSDCEDCELSRLEGASGYCDYHHALLIEQYEDGSLGWDNGTR